MAKQKHPLTQEEFSSIYSKVPRLTVEIIIIGEDGVFLNKRNLQPCKGMWHLPGGTVRYGEKLTEAVARIAQRELNIVVTGTKLLGHIEYPSHYENGLDSPVGIAFEVIDFSGELKINSEAKEHGWFKELPSPMHQEQIDFLKQRPNWQRKTKRVSIYLAGKLNEGEGSIASFAEELEDRGHNVLEKWWLKGKLPKLYMDNINTSTPAAKTMIDAAFESDIAILFPTNTILGAAVEFGAAITSVKFKPEKQVIVVVPHKIRQSVFYAHPAVTAVHQLADIRKMSWF